MPRSKNKHRHTNNQEEQSMVKQIVKQEELTAPWKTIPGEKMDVIDPSIPARHTAHLNNKTNKYKEPTINNNKCKTITCEMCNNKMEWDREVGYYFCTECVYSIGIQNIEKAKPWKEK